MKSVKDAFSRWALKSSFAGKQTTSKVKETLSKDELSYVTKIGGSMVLGATLISLMDRKQKLYNHIFFSVKKY